MKVLIIEDDKLFSEILKDEFEDAGCNVIRASDGEEGLSKMRTEQPDIVMLDIMMPKKNGMTVLEEKADDDSIKDIPVIVITVSANEKELEKTFMLGAKDAMIKSRYTSKGIVDRALSLKSSKK